MELTPSGRVFLDHARVMLSQAEVAVQSARRTAFPFLFLFLWHLLNLSRQSGPLQGHQAGGPQFHFGRFASHHFVNQMRP